MSMKFRTLLMSTLLLAGIYSAGAHAQPTTPSAAKDTIATPDNALMLTVFLKHDQSRPLGQLKEQLAKQEFYKVFPPAGVEVVSWSITMGIGPVSYTHLTLPTIYSV